MRARLLLLLLLTSLPALAGTPVDTGTAVRNTVLRAGPSQSSAVVADVAANATLDVYERQRLWMRAAPSGEPEANAGWLRFTELRLSSIDKPPAKAAAPTDRGGFAGFSRSVSGFLSSFRGGGQRSPQATATIGIRGLTVADLQAAHPDPGALAQVDRFAISPADAEQFAGAGGLSARKVDASGVGQ